VLFKSASSENRQLLELVSHRLGRPFEGIIDPAPQVAANKQLLPRQGHQSRQAPAQPRAPLQELDEQDGDQ